MESVLQGRLRNTYLPQNKGLIPIYEAVVNSIQSIEEECERSGTPYSNKKIDIEILRGDEYSINFNDGKQSENPITGFVIKDDGVGFTESNWDSFQKLDSLRKADKGCRGIGRLMWLKAFDRVEISSDYVEGQNTYRRDFSFDAKSGVSTPTVIVTGSLAKRTTVQLRGFSKKYSDAVHKTIKSIATGLLEHCLWYFVRDQGVPIITLRDEDNIIDLHDLYDEHMHSSAATDKVEIKDYIFEITHIKFRASKNKIHNLNYCAAGRLVKEDNISGKIAGLTGAIFDELGEFTYAAYITGPFLDERVVEQRIGFNIEDDVEGLFETTDISFQDIRNAVFPIIKSHLKFSLEKSLESSQDRVNTYVSTMAPGYRSIIPHIPADELAVNPNISNKDLDILLHKHKFNVEQKLLGCEPNSISCSV